jgi:ADP-heptose:LPS heptosyltransferase
MMGVKKSAARTLLEAFLVATLPVFVRPRPSLHVKALLVKPDRLGDLALTAPLIQTLITRLGADQIALVVSEVNAALARLIFPGVHIIQIPLYLPTSRFHDWIAAMRAVAHIEADDAFFLRHFWRPPHIKALWRSLRAKRHHWIVSAEKYISPEFADRTLLPGNAVAFTGPPPSGAALDAHLSNLLFASAYGAPLPFSTIPAPAFATPPPSDLGERVLFFPFSSDPIRDLTPALATGIVHHLATVHRRELLLCVTSDRLEDARRLCESIRTAHPGLPADTVRIWVPASFQQFHHAILAARFIVSTDTGPAHLAIIHDRPFVGLLGGGQFGVFAPWAQSTRQRWVWHPLPCYGCDWHCRFERAHCVTDIPLPSVESALDAALNTAPN